MRRILFAILTVGLVVPTAPLLGQSPEIQREIEWTLFWYRWNEWVKECTGMTPAQALVTLLALLLAVAAALGLWLLRRKKPQEEVSGG
jgi:hypothetical protein